jgi:hypothetical protein
MDLERMVIVSSRRDGAAFAARHLLELSDKLLEWSNIARQKGALWALVHHERFPEKQWCELEPQSRAAVDARSPRVA